MNTLEELLAVQEEYPSIFKIEIPSGRKTRMPLLPGNRKDKRLANPPSSDTLLAGY